MLLSSAKGVRYESVIFIVDYKCLVYGRSTCNLTESRLKVISKYSLVSISFRLYKID